MKHHVEDCVTVAWNSNDCFTRPDDSGSIYYAVRGCFRYPIAVHCATVVIKGISDEKIEKDGGTFEKLQMHARVSIGTPLLKCLNAYTEKFNSRVSEIAIDDEDARDIEDSCILPQWFDRLDLTPRIISAATCDDALEKADWELV